MHWTASGKVEELTHTTSWCLMTGGLKIDGRVCDELRATGHFDEMSLDVDEVSPAE